MLDRLLGGDALESTERHDAHGERGLAGDAHHHGDGIVWQQVGEIGRRGDALSDAEPGELAQAGLVIGQHLAVEADVLAHQGHRVGALQLAGRQTVRTQRHAGMIDAGAQQTRQLERVAVDVEDVAARMHHADGARRGNLVEVLPRDPPLAVIDRIEAPARQGPR